MTKKIKVKKKWNKSVINPLTPVPPITGHDEPWPFFHFWRHHFWLKLASSILNFYRRKRSFQWCPEQSDRLNGTWDMHKNPQKVERKTQTKISCHYTWLLHAKNSPSRWCFLRSFLTASKPSRRSITAAKRKEKPKDVGHFRFLPMPKSKCPKTWCWWQERQAVVLQMHFQPDWS